jgi:hypothetical protein
MTKGPFTGDPLRIYNALVPMEFGVVLMDTIFHEGYFWLVPEWLESRAEGWQMPERIICLMLLDHQVEMNSQFGDFVVRNPPPKGLLANPPQIPEGGENWVVVQPNLRFPLPPSVQ